jgi:hypothetical protein
LTSNEIIVNLIFEEADLIEQINGPNKITLEYYQKLFMLFYILKDKMDTQKHNRLV